MKFSDYSKVVSETPVFVSTFRIVKLPTWAKEHVEVGQLLAYNPRTGRLETRKGKGLNLGASYVEFVDYLTPSAFYSSQPDEVILGMVR